MNNGKQIWLLSEAGILDLNGEQVKGIPFSTRSVMAGDTDSQTAVFIVDGRDVWRWRYSAGCWEHLCSSPWTLNCICQTHDGMLLVGTEKARLAWVISGELDFLEAFDAMPERGLWKTPWGGPPDVRSLAVALDGTLYANIHVGWIASSSDNGESWKNLRNGLEMDVHQVAAHPRHSSIVYAATATGFYLSQDHGETFKRPGADMPYHYQRACACFPDLDVYLVSTSRGPHGSVDARLYRSEDAGTNWSSVNGLPDKISANIDTFQIVMEGPGRAFVVVEDTLLYESVDYGDKWKQRGEFPHLYGALLV